MQGLRFGALRGHHPTVLTPDIARADQPFLASGWFLAVLAALFVVEPGPARAEDLLHGRLASDLWLEAGVGGGLVVSPPEGPNPTGVLDFELRARVVDSAGLMTALEWRPESDTRWLLGVDLRPFFLPRFFLNAESGNPYIDLFIDSIGIDIGIALLPVERESRGLAYFVGAGFDIPLWMPNRTAEALYLHFGGRWAFADSAYPLAPANGVNDGTLLLSLTIRGGVSVGIASWEPLRYRR